MITQNFNTDRLVSTKKKRKNTQRLLLLWKITLGQGLSLLYKKKNLKTTINSDIRAHSVETEK